MKKIIAMLLAVLMLASILTGCGNNAAIPEEETEETLAPEVEVIPDPETTTETDDQPTDLPKEEDQTTVLPEETKPAETTKPVKPSQSSPQNTESGSSSAQPPAQQTPEVKPEEPKTEQPSENAPASINMDLSVIIDEMYKVCNPNLPVGTLPVDLNDEFSLSSFTGLTDASLIKEAVASESMIGSQAYSVVLVRLNNPADAETVAKAMRSGINQSKWICVTADTIRVVAAGDVVMLCMIASSLSTEVDTMVDAFSSVVGTSFTADIR